eukprot:gene7701-13528_t
MSLFADGYQRPDRVDLCIVLSTDASYGDINKSFARISKLIPKISISPSTTRIAVVDATTGVKKLIGFSSCVNRECVVAELAKLRLKTVFPLAFKLFQKHKGESTKKYILLITKNPLSSERFFQLEKILAKRKIILTVSALKSNGKGYMIFKKKIIHLEYLPFERESFTRCDKSGVVYDECNRKCYCIDGKMMKCARVRKEFTEMSIPERKRYISAFKKLAADERYKKRHENFVKIHKDLFFKGIHTKNYFLPWHRWYLLKFENLLREIDCRITIPYWDWAFWSDVPWVANMHIWNSHDYGLGGNGDPKKGYCVQDGPFKEGSFKTPDFDNKGEVLDAVAYAIESSKVPKIKTSNKAGCLRRSFNGKPVGVPLIRKILRSRAASFSVFENVVRVSLHNSMHNEIGGHMCSEYASVTPEFYLHHAFLDKLWYTWQLHSKACLNARFTKFNHKMTKFKCNHSQKEFIDSSKLPGHVDVTYTDYYYKYEKSKSHDIVSTLRSDIEETGTQKDPFTVTDSEADETSPATVTDSEADESSPHRTTVSEADKKDLGTTNDSEADEKSPYTVTDSEADETDLGTTTYSEADESTFNENNDNFRDTFRPPYKKHVYHEYIHKLLGHKSAEF